MLRITQHHESLVIKDIMEFIKIFKDYFVLNQKEFVYTTETGNTKKHPPSNCEITINGKFQKITHPDTSKSQTELILKQELLESARNSVSNQKFDSNIILNKIKTEMTSVRDLLYLAILSKIFEISKSQNFYNYDDAKYDLSVEYEEAIKDFDKEIEKHPEDHGTYYMKAIYLWEKEVFSEALKTINNAIKIKPGFGYYCDLIFNKREISGLFSTR